MPKKVTAANRKKFLADLHEHLLEMKTKLITEIDSELRAEREGNKDEGMDTYDLASEERDREINFILSDRERVKIKQIDDALLRMDEGSYGVCESCGLEVAEERLEAMPFTRLCRDCQQDLEREQTKLRMMTETLTTDRGQAESDIKILEAKLDQATANLGVAEALGRQVAGQLLHYVKLLDRTLDFCDQCTAATELDDLAEMVRLRDALARVWVHEHALEAPQACDATARR